MARIVWDQTGERIYETGVDMGVLYPQTADGSYPAGYAWNGLTAVNESPSGAEATPIYANNKKYAELQSAEEYGATIEAFTYPKEFEPCDGSAEIAKGVVIGQQDRTPFGLAFRTLVGNDAEGVSFGYKLHLIYGAKAAPSEKGHSTINENTEASTFSWTITTTPVAVEGNKPTASVVLDSRTVSKTKLAALEAILYGSESTEPRLPLPDEVATLMAETTGE